MAAAHLSPLLFDTSSVHPAGITTAAGGGGGGSAGGGGGGGDSVGTGAAVGAVGRSYVDSCVSVLKK